MKRRILSLLCSALLVFGGCAEYQQETIPRTDIPAYEGKSYIFLDDNVPSFTEDEITDESYEYYTPLDFLGRCGVAEASIGPDLMPTEERKSIGQVKPSGWQTVKYDFVDGKYLYNRCHLLGFQLTGENANERNLITGTRYMNTEEMLIFENMVADYIKETGNHVMYRVTPHFEGRNLVAKGVEMEGYSVEDEGRGISFHVFCYNIQPGVEIDYETGYSWASDTPGIQYSGGDDKNAGKTTYILNTNTQKYHKKSCAHAQDIREENKSTYYGKAKELNKIGYKPCGSCKPE